MAASPGSGAGRSAAAAVDDAHEELRRKKLTFLAVEAQMRFVEGCRSGTITPGGVDMEQRRQQARQRNKALKDQIREEREEHAKLCRQLSEVVRESTERHAECEREAKLLARLVEVDEAAEVEEAAHEALFPEGHRGAVAAGEEAAGQALRATSALTENVSGELLKRRRLMEEEAREIAKRRGAISTARAELERLQDLELQRVERLEKQIRKEVELGLPVICFDDANGRVVLEPGHPGSPVAAVKPEVRTVRVARDTDTSRLLRAEPHASLNLWDEGTSCVENDDLARLLTLVWHRLHGGPPTRGLEGGA